MWSYIWSVATNRIGFWTWIWPNRLFGLRQEVACWFQYWKNLISFIWPAKNTSATDVKMDKPVLAGKLSFKMLRLTFSSKLEWSSYIISIAKIAYKKIGTLIRSMKFLSSEAALYLYKSTIRPCMKCCCHVWAGASSYYLKLLDMLQKQIYRTDGP